MNPEKYSDARNIELKCIGCKNIIPFSILDLAKPIVCEHCNKQYAFNEEFQDKIRRFGNLLEAVYDARDLLGQTDVGIAFKDEEVKVPYRLLLTRLNTLLTLDVNGTKTTFRFRVEPLSMIDDKQ